MSQFDNAVKAAWEASEHTYELGMAAHRVPLPVVRRMVEAALAVAPSGGATPDPTWNAYVEAWMNGNYSGSADPMMSYEECRAKAENEANRYIAARRHQEKP